MPHINEGISNEFEQLINVKYLNKRLEQQLMKNIIIYGIRNAKLRSQVINYLSDKYKIIGVSDSILNRDILQEELYINPYEINLYEFDYILVLSEREVVQEEIYGKLTEFGINKDKIVVPRLLMQQNVEFIPDLKREIMNYTETDGINAIVMGLSYSLRGIDFQKLKVRSVDFSWHGLDLYYNLQLLKTIREKESLWKKIKTILLVFPVYYFNYDMSKSEYQFSSGAILACRGFQDWHNADLAQNKRIKEYLVCDQLFGKKFWEYKNWKKTSGVYESEMDRNEVVLPPIWKKYHLETWEENEKIMSDVLELTKNKRKLFIIPPIYKEVIKNEDWIWFYNMKNHYLDALHQFQTEYIFEIFDFSERIKDFTCFYDYAHLNEKGRLQFTDVLNEYL